MARLRFDALLDFVEHQGEVAFLGELRRLGMRPGVVQFCEGEMEAEERVNPQDEDLRRSPETAVSIDTNACIDTSKAQTAGFRGSQGSNLCPGVNCPAHKVRNRLDDRAPDVCA